MLTGLYLNFQGNFNNNLTGRKRILPFCRGVAEQIEQGLYRTSLGISIAGLQFVGICQRVALKSSVSKNPNFFVGAGDIGDNPLCFVTIRQTMHNSP